MFAYLSVVSVFHKYIICSFKNIIATLNLFIDFTLFLRDYYSMPSMGFAVNELITLKDAKSCPCFISSLHEICL